MPENRTRRYVLAALPALAVTAAACGSTESPPAAESSPASPTPDRPRPQPATPEDALEVLMKGNTRFAARTPAIRNTAEIDAIWTRGIDRGQAPFATVLGCADSRLAPEIIFDQFVGNIFVVREAETSPSPRPTSAALSTGRRSSARKSSWCWGIPTAGRSMPPTVTPRRGNIESIVAAIRPGIAGARDLEEAVKRNVGAVIDHVRSNSAARRSGEGRRAQDRRCGLRHRQRQGAPAVEHRSQSDPALNRAGSRSR